MASLRIKLPGRDEVSVIALRGDRITIGRRPDNTLQILDRTVSAYHAELIREDGHYRVHDLGSANGTQVAGDLVTDFHLRDACKMTFGTVECEFDPAEVPEEPEGLPTQAELSALLKDNEMLKAQLDTVRTELAALRTESPLNAESSGTVPREEFEKVVLDRASLSERLQRAEAQFAKVREELALLRRDRENLELAAATARKEVERLRASGGATPAKPAAAPAASPAPANPVPAAAPAGLPKPTFGSLPKPTGVPSPAASPAVAAVASQVKPAAPAGIPNPAETPNAAPIGTSPKAPAAAGVPSAMATTVRQAPGSGMLPGAAPRAVPAGVAGVRPAPAGPSGTQKIAVPGVGAGTPGMGKPAGQVGKTPLKPYVRPAVGAAAPQGGAPTVRARDPRLQPEPEEQGDQSQA